MIKWKQTTHGGGADLKRFDAKVGHLFVGCEDNGEGWYNWWIATAEQGVCPGEWMCLEIGGGSSEQKAKKAIRSYVKKIIEDIQKDMR